VKPERAARAAACAAAAILFATAASAHERFVKHDLKHPLQNEFFGRWPDHPLALHPSMMRIGLNSFAVLLVFLLVWFARNTLVEWVQHFLLIRIGGRLQRTLHQMACFVTDRPVRSRIFHTIGEWAVIMFLRSPGLVLMYSATNDSLVMPSYPLDPVSATFFKFAQVVLAILILTQTALPLCGAMILGTWVYLIRWGWMVSVDALPVLAVAVVYVTSPWHSHKLAITAMNPAQVRAARIVLGFGFLALGWLKIYNHNLLAGVADNYPSVMNDPMIELFSLGSGPAYRREAWIVAFGMAEVVSGFMLMIGVFTRVWAVVMVFIFTKLMLLDFGWDEIPHIYPIGALLAIMFSNELRSGIGFLEERYDSARRQGRMVSATAGIVGPVFAVAAMVVFPLLWLMTFLDRSKL